MTFEKFNIKSEFIMFLNEILELDKK